MCFARWCTHKERGRNKRFTRQRSSRVSESEEATIWCLGEVTIIVVVAPLW